MGDSPYSCRVSKKNLLLKCYHAKPILDKETHTSACYFLFWLIGDSVMHIRVVASNWFGSAPDGGRDYNKEVWPG